MQQSEKDHLKILLVEDVPDDAALIMLQLDRFFSVDHVRVDKAVDFSVALEDGEWDVVISDFRLPGFNALKALEICQNYDQNLPFIVVSGVISDDDAVALMDGGARDFIRKDNLSRLIPCLKRELRSRNLWQRHVEGQAKLAESERRFRAFIENTPTPMMLKAREGGFIIVNRPFEELSDKKTGRILESNSQDSYANETAPRFLNRDEQVISSKGPVTFEEDWAVGASTRTFMTVKFPVINDGTNEVEAIGSVRFDITNQKRSERELKLLLKLSNTIQKSLDLNTAISETLQLVCESIDWDYGEAWLPGGEGDELMYGQQYYCRKPELKKFHEASKVTKYRMGEGLPGRVAMQKTPEWHDDVTLLPEDEFQRVNVAREAGLKAAFAVPILSDDNDVIAVFAFFLSSSQNLDDRLVGVITAVAQQIGALFQKKRAEESLRQAHAGLEETVKNRTSELVKEIESRKKIELELIESKEKAEEATRAKSIFLASMSHEIRTPMNGVVGVLDLMGSSSLSREQADMVSLARSSANALLRVIDDILDFSKIEAGKLEIVPEDVSVRDIVENATQNLWLRAQSRSIDIRTYVDPSIDSCIRGDSIRLGQVLVNLMGNAVKFTENGLIDVSVTMESKTPEQVTLKFVVKDSGVGMNKEQVEKLFQPFTQADSNTSRKYGGTGLGLTISKRLCEMMEGKIGAESVLNEGSSFWFEIPFKRIEGKAVEVGKPYGGRRLLFCSAVSSELGYSGIGRYLREFGVYIERVNTIEGAKATLTAALNKKNPFDVVLVRPDFDGEKAGDLLDYIRGEAGFKKTAVVLQAPRQDATADALCAEHPFDGVLYRPLILHQVCAALEKSAGWPIPLFLKRQSQAAVKTRRAYREPSADVAADAGAVILVAEDNRINQIVIRKQLSFLGYAAEITDNGAMALRLLLENKKRYGMLLTDCHMPVLDGFELTKEIREHEKSEGGRLPIIALTADAIRGAEERCRVIGMDGYLTKPVELSALDAAICKWLPKALELRGENE